MADIFHLVYISEAAADISYTDIRDILETSRKANAVNDITGILLFRDGFFLQLLEGEESIVRDLLEDIRRDDRNYNLRVLVEEESSKRFFGDWAMAFHDADISSATSKMLGDLFAICLGPAAKDSSDFILPMIEKIKSAKLDLR